MVIILLLVASQVTPVPSGGDLSRPPELAGGRSIALPERVLMDSVVQCANGVTTVLLRVSAKAHVSSCQVTESSGSSKLDAAACTMVERSARFAPANDAKGDSIDGEYRMAIGWRYGRRRSGAMIDLPLQVSNLPPRYRSPVGARLLFDASGHVTACEITATSGSDAADRAVCAYVAQRIVMPPPSSIGGVPPMALRYLTASLTARPAQRAPHK